MSSPLLQEKVWFEKNSYDEAEEKYYTKLVTLQLGDRKVNNQNVIADNNKKIITSITNKTVTTLRNEEKVVKNAVRKINPSPEIKRTTTPPTPTPIIEELETAIPSKDVCIISAPGANPTPNTEKRFKQKENKERRKDRKRDNKDKKFHKDEQKSSPNIPLKSCLAGEVAKVRQHIKTSLECVDGLETLAKNNNIELNNRVNEVEKENAELKKLLSDLQGLVQKLNSRVGVLETTPKVPSGTPAASEPVKDKKEEDDDVDLFGSDSEDENDEVKRVKEARIAEYYAKKSKKPQLIAKSNIILDVKPWDDETNLKELEAAVRKIKMDGLLWGTGKLIPVAYGIFKLQISCVVEDEKVSVETLEENIKDLEDYVSSVDIVGFNKV